MTVAHWLSTQSPEPPAELLAHIVAVLGADARRPVEETANVCLAVAARRLQELVTAGRFERESALDLLCVDALVTFAFEHASASAGKDLDRFSDEAIMRLGALTPPA